MEEKAKERKLKEIRKVRDTDEENGRETEIDVKKETKNGKDENNKRDK